MTEFRVRYPGSEQALVVSLIHTWHRTDPDLAAGLIISTSGGPKEMFKNWVLQLFAKNLDADSVSMVRGGGSPFFLIRKGTKYFDVTTKEVEVAQKRAPAAAPPRDRREGAA